MAKKTTAAAAEVKDKDKLLKDVLNEIEREYGKGAIMKLGRSEERRVGKECGS